MELNILHCSIARRVILRALMIAVALSIVPLLQILPNVDPGVFTSVSTDDCAFTLGVLSGLSDKNMNLFSTRVFKPIWGSVESVQCKSNVNMTTNVVRELMGMNMLSKDAIALCVGPGSASTVLALRELGFSNARGVYRHPFLSLKHRKFVYELEYQDRSFDFVLCRDPDNEVSIPALLVLEIERVLKPGGIGAMLVNISRWDSNSLIRSATPISSLLKSSNVEHVGYIENFTLVVFKKKSENFFFEPNRLPADCQSVVNNKPYMDYMEPLLVERPTEFENRLTYLPSFLDVSSRKKLVYVDVGAAEHLNSNATSWFLPSYPVDSKVFNTYFVDHNTSVMLSYVRKPGINFVYHPGLAGRDTKVTLATLEDMDLFVEDQNFDFIAWFKETVELADFVVLKMNTSEVQLKFLMELLNSGTICLVDELFLRCSGRPDCMDIFTGLRSNGVFVHQWWGY